MTKRERQYHLLRKLFKPCTIPFSGTQMISVQVRNLTTADIEKAIAEIKETKSPPPPLVTWDSLEEVKARQDYKYAWMKSFGFFGYTPLHK